MQHAQPIGVFDSGYGGLTVLKDIRHRLPLYDYLYLGDNARAPYGSRSFETVYRYTLECVEWFFRQGCHLVVLACNTASAKALRSIQQHDLPTLAPGKRVLGVIRPTTEMIGNCTQTQEIGILATSGTVLSNSYLIEIEKFFPDVKAYQEACPMWVPLVESGEYDKPGADYFVKQHIDRILKRSPRIDTLLLACTHYPLLKEKIAKFIPAGMQVVSQGQVVADSLAAYLARHPEIDAACSKNGESAFFTTDSPSDFDNHARIFFGEGVQSQHADLIQPPGTARP